MCVNSRRDRKLNLMFIKMIVLHKTSLSDAIRHIDHIVDLIGIDHVGIGSDFDGDGELIGCRASNELINITMRLLKEGYTENDIAKIWGGNLLRVMNKAQSAPDNSL